MANIKSAKKRILVNRTKAERNKAIKSSVKTAIKKVFATIEAGDKKAAEAELTLREINLSVPQLRLLSKKLRLLLRPVIRLLLLRP